MPFPCSLLCLLPLRMLNIDAEKLTIVCPYSYLHFHSIVDSFFFAGVLQISCVIKLVCVNKA